ncbi:DUF3426 domain-containing protein, partial [bacterium]|nr:DUF3426 domain-containing protein [bacterium]
EDDKEIIEDDDFELEFDVEEDIDLKDEDMSLEIESDEENEPVVTYDEEDQVEQTGQDKFESIEEDIPVITLEDDFSEYDDVLDQETEPELTETLEEESIERDGLKEEEILIPQEEINPSLASVPSSRVKKKKSVIGTPILILLLICLLGAGAYIASVMTGYKIPYISDIKIPYVDKYLKKPVPKVIDVKPVPNQKSVNGRFVTNEKTGTLFVITGRVDNISNIVYSHIQVQGTLITKGQKEEKRKNVFCGNILTEEMLKTGDIAEINKILVVKTGNNNLNVKIKPKTSVSFMIVFSELPEKLENFTVKVIGFDKVEVN